MDFMFGDNLKYLRKKHKLSQQELSSNLGIPRTTLGDYERNNTEPSFSLLVQMARFFDISLESILTEDLSLESYEVTRSGKMKVLAITVDSANEGNIELVESKAEAGYLDSYQNPEFIKELPKLKFPMLSQGTFRGFEIQGDSMLPIESGSIVICAYLESLKDIKNDNSYIITSHREGMVYKRIQKDENNDCLILSSDNPIYPSFTLPYEDINEVWEYRAHISFSDGKAAIEACSDTQIKAIQQKLDKLQKSMGG